MATPGRAVRIECGTSTSISQPKLFDYVAGSPAFNKTSARTTRSQTAATSNPPERDSERITNKQRKAEKKRLNKKSKKKNARNLSGGSSSSSQSDEAEDDSQLISSPTATRTISQMLNSAYDSPPSSPSPSPSSSPSNSEDTDHDIPLDQQLANCQILISYLEKENKALKNENDLINDDLSTANKLLDKQKKLNKKLTTECDQLKRNASKNSGIRKFMNVDISTETDSHSQSHPQSQAKSQPNDIVVAQLNSLRDHVTKVANDLLQSVDSAPSYQPPQPSSQPPSQPPPSQQSHETPFTPVRNKRSKNKPPPPRPYSDAVANGIRTNTTSSHHRPGQGARQRNKTIILGTSLTDGISTELNKLGVKSTTHIYRGGKLDLIRDRVPHIFPKDPSKQPDKIVLLAGGNDAEEFSADRVTNEYDGLIRDIRKVCLHSQIILSSIPFRKNDSKTNGKIMDVNDYLKDRGQRRDNVLFADIAPTDSSMSTYKKVHFNNKGKSEFAKGLKPFLIN